jgi:hypothetical protein
MRRWLVVSAIAAVIVVPGAVAQGKPDNDEPPSPVVVEVSDGFHWKDAGVGAVAALALVTIAFGVVLVVRGRPETPPATQEADT